MLQPYNKGLLPTNNPRLKFLSNYYEVGISNKMIFCYQFIVEGVEASAMSERYGEVFKACLLRTKEVFDNKFLF